MIRSIEAAVDTLRDLGDVSTSEAISHELSRILESNELVMDTGFGPIVCLLLKLYITAYQAMAALLFLMWIGSGGERGEFLTTAIIFLEYVALLQIIYNEQCGGDQGHIDLASADSTDILIEEYASSECNLCNSALT
jgi:hypothetical protein